MWTVQKFGGTSVGSADSMRKCIAIVKPLTKDKRVAMVVSAIGGKPKVTDLLLDLVRAAAVGNQTEINEKMQIIKDKHKKCVQSLLLNEEPVQEKIINMIESDLSDIADLLRAVTLMRMAHEQILELVSGYGEIWSATIVAAAMQAQNLPFVFLNARDVLFVDNDTKVFWEESTNKLTEFIASAEDDFRSNNSKKWNSSSNSVPLPHLVITGYVASTLEGVATTLKRDGSDYSASIFGKMLQASDITIWTDVSGVYSADPRRVADAQILPDVSYSEAIELAYFGAKVIHPKTMEPAISCNIPIFIRNTFAPEHPGTRIFLSTPKNVSGTTVRERAVCGFTTIDNMALLNLAGTGMIGVPGVAHRLFGALNNAGISVTFIAQASSEHSICFATRSIFAEKAQTAIREAFFYELKQGSISDIRVINDCSIIAAVGESMSNTPGVSGLFFGALGEAAVNILSISQGCDERNISAVVYTREATKALRAVHAAFWLSSLELSIGIVGTGRVGSVLLQSLIERSEMLGDRLGLKIKIRGVANSRKMLLGEDLAENFKNKLSFFTPSDNHGEGFVRKSDSKVSLQDMEQAMTSEGDDKEDTDLKKFLSHVKSGATPHAIIVDATTSNRVASLHPACLLAGAHLVTANKRALSSSLDLYNTLFSAVKTSHNMYMSEVTIGASLPIRTTLNDILCSGDSVYAIEGLFSASAGMIMTSMCDDGMSFSEAVKKTYAQGLFEDDTFVDLEGAEPAEKVLILGRELGIPLEMSDLDVEPLAKRRHINSWLDITNEFAEEDVKMAERLAAAASRNCTLRYVQRIECSPAAALGVDPKGIKAKASVRLEEVPKDGRLAMIKGACYHFAFHTERYSQNPLIVQGPLSDPANTASGIVGDILRIARSIGAKDRGPDKLMK